MTIETGILLAVCSLAIAAATFFIGRTSAAKQEGETMATMRTDILYIKDSLKEIKDGLRAGDQEHSASIRRVHDRIDEHLRSEHNMKIPKYNGSEG